MRTMYRHRAVTVAVAAVLLGFGCGASAADIQQQSASTATTTTSDTTTSSQQSATPPQTKARTLQAVTVLGSMIPRAEIEGPAPVRVITGTQIKAEGYTTVYEFLNSLPQASGNMSQSSSWGSSAPNAQTVNLRGLGPQYTLLLVDGRRMVDYPAPQNGTGNYSFQNAANIPVGMIDRVEVMATGASSIYGSDAVAGVVNIILKKHYQGDQISVKVGGDTEGGQNLDDITFQGGRSGDGWRVVYSLEHKNRSILQAKDRSPDYNFAPNTQGYETWSPAQRAFGWLQGEGGTTDSSQSLVTQNGTYVTPPPGSCRSFGGNDTQVSRYSMPTSGNTVGAPVSLGVTCAQPDVQQDWVFSPGLIQNDGYVHAERDITPNLTVYAGASLFLTDGIYNYNNPGMGQYAPGMPGAFYDKTTGDIITNYVRRFTAQEMGNSGNNHDHEKYWNLVAGIKGNFLENFDWDVNVSSQKYLLHDYYSAKNEGGMFNYFFGPQQGTTTVNGTSYPVYQLNTQRFFSPLTPQQYSTFGVYGENSSSSELDAINFNINNTELFSVPWNSLPVGWAAVVQAEHNNFWLDPDPRSVPSNALNFQDPFGLYNAGGGTRQHYAVGTEFRVPLTSMLTWDISGRIDKYHDASTADIARTWQTSLEFRPVQSLLLRATYGTNFMAPGMDAIYLADSINPIGLYSDPLECIKTGDRVCPAVPHSFGTVYSGGNTQLQPETGKSWTAGFVWSLPWVNDLNVQADYWNITSNDQIDWIGSGQMLTDEAGCLTGLQVDGSPYIAHPLGSAYCKEAIANVVRNAQGVVTEMHVGPINESQRKVDGVDAGLDYGVDTGTYGTFKFSVNWSDTLQDKSKTVQGDPFTNNLPTEVKSRSTWSVNWHRGPWHATVSGIRWGSIRQPNFGGCETLPNGIVPSAGTPECLVYQAHFAPWVTWSAMVGYQVTRKLNLEFNVDNIFNKMPEIAPYTDGVGEFQQETTPAGRSLFLTASYKLD